MDSVIPQKRPLDSTTPTPAHTYLTRAKVSEQGTPITKTSNATVNKFAPVIAYRTIDFEPDARFSNIDDIPLNTRRGFQYAPCAPSSLLPVLKFASTDAPPYRAALNVFDRSAATELLDDFSAVTTRDGWVSARANVGIREGNVYLEFIVKQSDSSRHVRLGLTRREASIEAPVGYDGYGYGLRDIHGNTVHLSRPREFEGLQEGFHAGDVIGLLVELPIEDKLQDVVREQIAIRYRQHSFFEKLDYIPTKEMDHYLNPVTVFGEKAVRDTNRWKPETLKGSKVTVYKNGKLAGIAFEDLYSFLPPNSELKTGHPESKFLNNGTLGYYPTISVFRDGVAELNAGPEFVNKPEDLPPNTQSIQEVYESHIADDIVWDIIDEIEAESISDPTFESFI
ncbi:CYFA0S03e05820g1_1 [Cyberlindnera fabianii]|uniref:CYFA0S03e05820g1_1 n=1 Tax=Cyberlindnera fabianii TaxID=36022 RepID=A0A061AR71_CYBFA|nr:CYFA0S03e05820g1_1 [Cyberlindnera fabianii]